MSTTKTKIFEIKSDLSLAEVEKLANEIHSILTHGKGMTLEEFVERAKTIPLHELGLRRYNAIKNENKLRMYFPDKVIDTLQARKSIFKTKSKFNADDDNFIRQNFAKGSIWIAKRFYTNYREILARAKRINVKIISQRYNEYTPYQDKIIIENYKSKGPKWISEQLGITSRQVSNRFKVLTNNQKFEKHHWKPEELRFIANNIKMGYKMLSEKFHVSTASIRCKVKELKNQGVIYENSRRNKRMH